MGKEEENKGRTNPGEDEYEKTFLEAVDEGLSVLGENIKRLVYYQMERHNIKRRDIPKNPEAFDKFLKDFFSFGASVIEEEILKRFYKKLNLEFEVRVGWSFREYVDYAIRASKMNRG